MGKEIVYCEICGNRILEQEFERGKAITLLNKHYCSKCKQEAVKNISVEDISAEDLEEEPRKSGSSARIPLPRAANRERTPPRGSSAHLKSPPPPKGQVPHRPPPKSNVPWIVLGGALASAAVLGIILLLPGSGPATSSDPGKPAAPKADQTWQALQIAIDRARMLGDYEGGLGQIERAKADLAGSRYEADLQRLRTEFEEKKNGKKLDALLAEIVRARSADNQFLRYPEILSQFEAAEAEARRSAKGRIPEVENAKKGYANEFEGAANQIYMDILEQVRGLMELEEWENAMKVIDKRFPQHFRPASIWRTTLEPWFKKCEERLKSQRGGSGE